MNKKLKSILGAAALGAILMPAWAAGELTAMRKAPKALTPPEPSTVLCGIMSSNDEWTDASEAGVYTIEVKPEGAIKCLHRAQDMVNTAAALMHNNIMYAVTATSEGFFYNKYSTNDWSRSSREEIDAVNVPCDLTYDPKTGKAYGAFYDSEEDYYSRICSFGLNDAEATSLKGYWDKRDYRMFAATPDGTVYTLFSYGRLGKINVTNRNENEAIISVIGTIKLSDGFSPDNNLSQGRISSMTYDAENNRLLAVMSALSEKRVNGTWVKTWGSFLVSIDPETAACTEIRRMPGNACFAGIYVMERATDPMAPGTASGLAVVPDAHDPLKGTVSFSIPATTFGGAQLTAQVMAIIEVNGTQKVEGYYSAGETVEIPVDLIEGDNTVRVTLATDEQRGESVEKTIYSGEDTPQPVTDVRVSVENGKALLSWSAPAGGANGGSLIPANVRYKITRMPDNKTVATDLTTTSFTDSNLPADTRVIYYSVLAYNSKGEATAAVESNRVAAAGAFDVPFTESFDSADDFALWTVIDLNGSPTWSYSDGTATYINPEGKNPGDDWLISPAINVEEGKMYRIKYDYRAFYKDYPESFEIKAGTGMTADDMTVAIATHENITNTKMTSAEAAFKATKSGKWYFGIHYVSPAKMYRLSVDNFSITEFDGRVPAQVSDLTVTPGAKGAMTAKVSFTVPTEDANGNKLTKVTKAELLRDNTLQKTFTEIKPGDALEFDDTVTKAATYTYSVKVYNLSEAGVEASASAFIGEDKPAAPSDPVIKEEGTHPCISWSAPAKGDNGGWFDPAQVTYSVYRGSVKVGDAIEATQFVDNTYTIPTDRQDAISYIVITCYKGVSGRGVQSDAVIVGAPYKAPVTETFPEADLSCYPWLSQSFMAPTYAWTLETSGVSPVVADNTGDRGLACFHAVGESKGVVSYFYSPKFDISGLESPVMSFYMYHTPSIEGDGSMQVSISTDGGEFKPVGDPIMRAEGDADGWVNHIVDLAAYKNAKFIRVCFAGTGDAAANIFIDDIRFDNIFSRDTEVLGFSAPARVAAGQTFPVEVKIGNIGIENLTDLTLTITSGEEVIALERGIAIEAGSAAVIASEIKLESVGTHTLTATISNDDNGSNNSATASVKIVEPVLQSVSGLEATVVNGDVHLSWKAPSESGAVTDDVESYKDWAIANVGEWSMYDGDYALTVYINKDLGEYPDAQSRKAFQVCNASTLGIDIWEQGKTHSGNKMFMAVASMNYVNNDWLISPRLNGAAQWISFFARSFTIGDGIAPERMKVWYSMTDTDPVNFTALTENYVELGSTWLEYRYYLPEGARYFAINCVSDDSFAMFVDDLTFNDMTVPVWKLTGYEVTCDGTPVATVTEPEFVHEFGGGKYAVRPLFEEGNGAYCDPVEVIVSGIDALGAGVSVTTAPGKIIVKGTSSPVTVTNMAGISFTASAGVIPAAAGVYLVTVDGATVKVVVK